MKGENDFPNNLPLLKSQLYPIEATSPQNDELEPLQAFADKILGKHKEKVKEDTHLS